MRASEHGRAGRFLLLAAALLSSLPAQAFDPERDTWLLPAVDPADVPARHPSGPLDHARIKATGNDADPEYATDVQRGLIAAAEAGDRQKLELLLQQGVNPNAVPDLFGRTALLHAVDRGDAEMVRLLLDAGADPDQRGGGYTPLVLASMRGHARIAELLLRAGADIDRRSADGNTPVTAAAALDRLAVARVLVRYRPDYSLYNKEGMTALGLAAWQGFNETLQVFLEAGADPNQRDRNGNMPLFWAGFGDQTQAARMLIKFGGISG